jgi:hypothetical protein
LADAHHMWSWQQHHGFCDAGCLRRSVLADADAQHMWSWQQFTTDLASYHRTSSVSSDLNLCLLESNHPERCAPREHINLPRSPLRSLLGPVLLSSDFSTWSVSAPRTVQAEPCPFRPSGIQCPRTRSRKSETFGPHLYPRDSVCSSRRLPLSTLGSPLGRCSSLHPSSPSRLHIRFFPLSSHSCSVLR